MTAGIGRVLVVGAGWIAHRVHLPYLARARQAGALGELLVADTDSVRAEAAAREFGARVHAGPVEEAGADLALVATPPSSHAALVLRALQAGAQAIVEKPLALTAGDAAAIWKAAAASGRGVYPLYTSRHRPEVAALRDAGAELGDITQVRAVWKRRMGVPATAGGRAAGVLWDLGPHLADLALHLAGWTDVTGTATARHQHPATAGRATAAWQTTTPPAGTVPSRPRWYGVSGTADLHPSSPAGPARRLQLEASWAAPGTAHDQVRIDMDAEKGSVHWRTVLGWSPDRATAPTPTAWTVLDGRRHVLIDAQPRDARHEYTAQLDAAFAALTGPAPRAEAAQHLRAACASTALLHAMDTALSGTAQPFTIAV
ncbi:Gfo/Idh/MocA family oxidoreductase [Streptomyces sp. AV19]|uniref:Gfo/Idh/MocA family protein n=1 Tax=Streptomyces sp. AV19 TaxID=2793068 RepID=UPI0018FEDBAE|nr:Gfo/Idh/MocA family oxidoreductase [Streptomyces sp. AV19]MBH1938936.1 Gfo/Idh/MocA family oxidoreductase [Streptomyces sp. AV19]MDG4536818.1 Gfo/Idh/MocA family oxidoreductase [Streptomyces sp. AV19]